MSIQKLRSVFRENKQVRILLFPGFELARRLLAFTYSHSKDADYIRSLKDSHRGESCFVIGNGPSLLPKDLDQISEAGIPSIATNRIYYIFSQTIWRPTYYMCLDPAIVAAELEKIVEKGTYQKFINYRFKPYRKNWQDNIHFLCTYSRFSIDSSKMTFESLSEDLSKYGTKTATVTANGIELAVYMGFKTIYLLGVDNKYAAQRQKDGTITIDQSMKSSYFQGMQENAALGKPIQALNSNENYEVAKNFADTHGVKIYNATRGGKLEVFERVDFDELMKNIREKA